MTAITTPHDALFKTFLTDPKIAKDFLEIHLPKSIRKHCDFSSLKLENSSFIEDHFQQKHADALYSLRIKNKKAYIYILIEAQSTPQKLMPFRMLGYQVLIMKRHLDQGHKTLPMVIPLLFYSGQTKPYPYPVDLCDCFEDPKLARKVMFKSLQLIDLSQIPDEDIQEHKGIALLEGVMKHIYTRDALNLAAYLMDIVNSTKSIHKLIENVIEYVIITKDLEDSKGFVEALVAHSTEYKEELMYYKDNLRREGFEDGMQEGFQKGVQKGREEVKVYKDNLRREGFEEGKHIEALEIARNLLAKGCTPEFIKEVTSLSTSELQKLAQHPH